MAKETLSQRATRGADDNSITVDWDIADGFKNIEEVLKAEKEYRLKIEADIMKTRLEEGKRIMSELAKMEAEGIKLSNAQKKAFLKEQEKESLKKTAQGIQSSGEKKATEKKTKKDEEEAALLKKLIAAQEELVRAEESGDDVAAAAAQEQIDAIKKQQLANENNAKLQQNLLKNVGNAINEMGNEVNSLISTFSSYQSAINTRLDGTGENFNKLRRGIVGKLGSSPFVKTQKVLDSLQSLVAEGISFNLEQRTFLASLSDKIATTFEIANESLLKIVKLQQADSSAARLGMEASLNKFLNENFQNTEYLNKNFDSVTTALLDASAQMTTQQAVEFEYIVQKWLGAMSSVGLSDNTVSGIAQAIGWLGTGDISQLSNSPINNLIVMAANRAGLDYSQILIDGIDSEKTNTLLQHAVEYLQTIATNDNKVVKSQLASTFGINTTDLVALTNLTDATIKDITDTKETYSSSIKELTSQFRKLVTRVSVPEMMQNLIDNFKFSMASTIAGNPVTATTWAITDLIEKYTGGINIPAFQTLAMGTGGGFDLNATVEGLIKTGMLGIGALGGIGSVITGLAGAAVPDLLLASFGIKDGLTTTNLYTAIQASKKNAPDAPGPGPKRKNRGLLSSDVDTTDDVAPDVGSGADGANSTLDDATSAAEEQQASNEKEKTGDFKDKALSDIYFYLLDLLDPKLTAIATMTAAMAGYSVETTKFGENKTNWEFEYGTSIKVSAGGADTKTQLTVLEGLSTTVTNIYELLKERMPENIYGIASDSTDLSNIAN